MKEFQRKQKVKKRLYSLPMLVFLFLVLILLAKAVYGAIEKQQESARYARELNQELVTLNERETELRTKIQELETEEGRDKEIKEKFTVTKGGEQVAIIVEPRQATVSNTSTNKTFWKSWWTTIRGLWQD